ncbi:hypothetical protein, partial [Enterobacter hormaechei]|uniref:hypothetical protein n=1 Tax=Enterobacter hormaechei TaxID=158836 RepID=UPI000A9A6069
NAVQLRQPVVRNLLSRSFERVTGHMILFLLKVELEALLFLGHGCKKKPYCRMVGLAQEIGQRKRGI